MTISLFKERKQMSDKVKHFYYKITYPFRNVYRNIKRIISWIPVLWNNYDWDYSYFLDVMRFKLEKMHDFYTSDAAISSSSSTVAKDIKLAINLIKRIDENIYTDKMREDHDKKWGKLRLEFKKNEDNPHLSTAVFSRSKFDENNKKMVKQEREEFRAIYEYGEKMINQDIEYLFRHIAKNLRSWWD